MADESRDDLESRRILERVGDEAGARMRPRENAGNEDWAEFWGRRIGRVLSFVLLIVALLWIYQLLTGTG